MQAGKVTPLWLILFTLGATIHAGDSKSGQVPIEWRQLAEALKILPVPEDKGYGRYWVPEEKARQFKEKVEQLKSEGDIIPPIIERLRRNPSSQREEAETLHLMQILKETPDTRALPVLEKFSASKPKTTWHMNCEGDFRFPYHRVAKEAADNIHISLATAEWEESLKGASPEVRRKTLADACWSSEKIEFFSWQAAWYLSNKELNPTQRLMDLESRLEELLKNKNKWKHGRLNRASVFLEDAGKIALNRNQAERLLKQISESAGDPNERAYAGALIKNLNEYWNEIKAKGNQP